MAEYKKIKIAHVITRMDWGGSPDIVRLIIQGTDTARYESFLIAGLTKFPSAKTKEFFDKVISEYHVWNYERVCEKTIRIKDYISEELGNGI